MITIPSSFSAISGQNSLALKFIPTKKLNEELEAKFDIEMAKKLKIDDNGSEELIYVDVFKLSEL